LSAHAAREGEQVDELKGPHVPLQAKAAELIGLAVHELTVNAVKYGALQPEGGHLSVRWDFEGDGDDRALVIHWVEAGVAIAPARRQPGFGTELLERTLTYELGGESQLTFGNDGITCVIRLPVSDRLLAKS
jgi:two-component system CheB/CheR fusion protein